MKPSHDTSSRHAAILARPRASRPPPGVAPGAYLERAAVAAVVAVARTGGDYPIKVARSLWPDDEVTQHLLTRAATAPASTTVPAWAGILAAQATGDFFSSLPESAGAKLIAAGLRLGLDGYGTLALPRRTSAVAAAPPWVGEGGPIPARSYTAGPAVLGPAAKIGLIAMLSRELAASSAAEAVITAMLREDASRSLDAALFSAAAAVPDLNPPGLLNGVTALTPTAGGGLAAMEADLSALAGAVAAAGSVSVVFIANPRQAMAIKIRKPELAIPVWPSAALAAGTVIALDPASFVSAFGPESDIDASEEAAVHMETVPAQISTAGVPNVAAASVVSAFQSRLVALRVTVEAAFTMRASSRIAHLAGATW